MSINKEFDVPPIFTPKLRNYSYTWTEAIQPKSNLHQQSKRTLELLDKCLTAIILSEIQNKQEDEKDTNSIIIDDM